ncbi:FtsH protease activity modulator HflK [bacterium]|nr:FtsH protease activity modulator HflK [bacterium]
MKNIVNLHPDDGNKMSFNAGEIQLSPKIIGIIILVLFVVYLGSGIYIIGPDEQAVVKRFGAFIPPEVEQGLHYHFPWPIEEVIKLKVTETKRIEIGFRTINMGPTAQYNHISEEARMLTGDENIISIEMVVQYRVLNLGKYLFKVENQERTLKQAAEASLRQIIGQTMFDKAITTEKQALQDKIKILLQKICDDYDIGFRIEKIKFQDVKPPDQVMEAFKDVSSAREDSNRYINEAQAYYNDIVPKAEGIAAQMTQEATAYKLARINQASGEAEKFLKIYNAYAKAPEVTKSRLYFETVMDALKDVKLTVVDEKLYDILDGLKGIIQKKGAQK